MEINLDDWKLFSKRKNSYNYISSDGKWMLKASSEHRTLNIEDLQYEQHIINVASSIGISTPAVGEIVTMPDGRPGMIYEYMEGKVSYSRYIEEHPEQLFDMIKKFAIETKKFHSITADEKQIPAFATLLKEAMDSSPIYNEREKDLILNKVYSLPDAKTCLHGDLQPSNIILVDDKSYWIDLGMISYGNPLYDIGFLWYVIQKSDERVFNRVFHSDKKTAGKMWETYARAYFDSDDMEAIEEIIKPYAYTGVNIMLKPMPTTGFITYNKELILSEVAKK